MKRLGAYSRTSYYLRKLHLGCPLLSSIAAKLLSVVFAEMRVQ